MGHRYGGSAASFQARSIHNGAISDHSMRGDGGGADFAELQRLLGQADGETIDIAEGKKLLSDEDLAILTDRSVEAFERAEKGLDVVGDAFKAVQTKKDGEGGLLESLQK